MLAFLVFAWLRLDLGVLAVLFFVPYFMHPKHITASKTSLERATADRSNRSGSPHHCRRDSWGFAFRLTGTKWNRSFPLIPLAWCQGAMA